MAQTLHMHALESGRGVIETPHPQQKGLTGTMIQSPAYSWLHPLGTCHHLALGMCLQGHLSELKFFPSSSQAHKPLPSEWPSHPYNLLNFFSPSSSTFPAYLWKELVTTKVQRGLGKSRSLMTQQRPPDASQATAPPFSHLFKQQRVEGFPPFLPSFLASLLSFLPSLSLSKIPVEGCITSSPYTWMLSVWPTDTLYLFR